MGSAVQQLQTGQFFLIRSARKLHSVWKLEGLSGQTLSPLWSASCIHHSVQDVGVAKAVYKTLMKVSSLMENDGFPQSWDADKLVKFQIIVDRQIEESKCVRRLK